MTSRKAGFDKSNPYRYAAKVQYVQMTIEMMILAVDRCKGELMVNLTEAYWYGLYFYCGKGPPPR